MSVCMMDDSPWCSEGTCKECDAARHPKERKPTLSAVTTKDLEEELTRRKEAERLRLEAEHAAKVAKLESFLSNPVVKQFLIFMLPDHSRTTCKDDESLVNVDRCFRCTTLYNLKCDDFEELERRLRFF